MHSDSITAWITEHLGVASDTQARILASILICVFLWLLRRIVLRVVWKRTEDVRTRYMWGKTVSYATVFLGILVVGRLWLKGIHSVATFLGLFSAGLAVALRDPVTNLAGWVFIVWRRPFELGDRIEVGEVAGDVIDIRLFQFTLLEIGNWVLADQSTGRIIHVPNSHVFTHEIANYGKGFQFIWNEIPVVVTFESDWEKARDILHEIASRHAAHLSEAAARRIREAARRFLIFYTKLTPIVYTSVVDNGIRLTIRYLCEPRKRRGTESAIWEDILREFAACDDIDFAYPTTRFYDNRAEGKPALRPPQVADL